MKILVCNGEDNILLREGGFISLWMVSSQT